MAIEKFILPSEDDQQPKLSVHFLKGVIAEYLTGEKTGIECRDEIEAHLGQTLSTDERSDLTSIVNYIDGGSTLANKIARSDEAYRVFLLAEQNCTWYNTRAKLRNRLSLINDE